MCAYAYYEEDSPLISDQEFDELGKHILEHWDAIEHPHKKLLDKSMLEAGTYLGEYPEIVKGNVRDYRATNRIILQGS